MSRQREEIKIVVIFFLILIIVLSPPDVYHFVVPGFLLGIFVFILFNRISPILILKRSLVLLPFTLFSGFSLLFFKEGSPIFTKHLGPFYIIITREGFYHFLTIFSKSWFSLLFIIILYESIGFPGLLKGFKKLHTPCIFLDILSFMYRYMHLFSHIASYRNKARELRDFGGKRSFHIKVYANIIGLLFIEAYEKAERVYDAMRLRGYSAKNDYS